ncbi:MAG: hypothetical protein KF817_08820 [Phycisphaeraceae bacterium]|nr:hypothetical protein [Phycisphaeraceae bacterium]
MSRASVALVMLFLPATSTSLHAGFTHASIQEMGSLLAGTQTYRVLLHYNNPLDKQLAVSGALGEVPDGIALSFDADSPLVQGEAFPVYPLLDIYQGAGSPVQFAYDSWVTLGLDASRSNVAFTPGFAGGNGTNSVIQGASWGQLNNGGYFDQNPGVGSEVFGPDIVIAQFTLAEGSTFTFQGMTDYLAGNVTGALVRQSFLVPTPGALAMILLAGIPGRRRRARVA